MNDLETHLQKNLGNYRKCEVIEIFGLKENTQNPFNIFTLIVFEDTAQENIQKMMTDKLQTFLLVKNIQWGIKRRIIDIITAIKLFNDLCIENKFFIDKEIDTGRFTLLTELYVASSDEYFQKIEINKILKNNFDNGSYLFEFFDEEKDNVNFLLNSPATLDEFSKTVNAILPIALANIPDRLGNIIFQLPVNSLKVNFSTIRKENPSRYGGIILEIVSKNINFDIKNLNIRVFENNDNIVNRQKFVEVKNNITNIYLDDCFGTHIEIFDKNSSLLVYKNKFSIMKQINLNMGLIEPQKRVFEIDGEVKKVQLTHETQQNILKIEKKEHNQWVSEREKFKIMQTNTESSQHYYKQRQKALAHVRELINKFGKDEVYLIDPFLSIDDIKNTLFECSSSHTKLMAISGLEQRKLTNSKNYCIFCKSEIQDEKLSKKDMINSMRDEIEKIQNETWNIDLEIRAKYRTEIDFHDRYLICIDNSTKDTKVYNLGTSINSLGGDKFHSISKVDNVAKVIEFIEKIWKELEKEECLVWKTR